MKRVELRVNLQELRILDTALVKLNGNSLAHTRLEELVLELIEQLEQDEEFKGTAGDYAEKLGQI